MTSTKGWAILKRHWNLRRDIDGTVALYPSRRSAQDDCFTGELAIRVKIEGVAPICRSGCGLVDDVPVFCKRHKPQGERK